MKPHQLSKLAVRIFGDRGWQTRLAEALEVDGSTVRRWVSGAVPVPGPVAAAVKCLAEKAETARRQNVDRPRSRNDDTR